MCKKKCFGRNLLVLKKLQALQQKEFVLSAPTFIIA